MFKLKKQLKYETGLIPLSRYAPSRSYPALYDGKVHNSKEADIFHKKVKEKLGISCVSSILRGLFNDTHTFGTLYISVDDNEASEKVLNHKTYKHIRCDSDFFHTVIDLLLESLKEENPSAYSIVSTLYNMEKTRYEAGTYGTVYLSIDFGSFSRTLMNEIYGSSSVEIDTMFKNQFPQYQHLTCCCYSLSEYDTFADHLFLFFTPSDLEKARSSGDLEKMIKESYAIVEKNDHLGLFTEDIYRSKLQVDSRRNFTKDDLFCMLRGK